MNKNLNLKVDENLFYEFHRVKSLLRAGTNQTALSKLLIIADLNLKDLSKAEREKFLKELSTAEREKLEIPS